MTNYDFKKEVEERLLQTRHAKRINKNQIALRCQFCGDSKKDPNKTRFYVQINADDDNKPIVYYCFNCNVSGVLTPSVLRTFDISDLQLNSSLTTFNKKVNKTAYKHLGGSETKLNLEVPRDINQTGIRSKVDYLNGRLGLSLSFKDWCDLKAVISLQSFLEHNKIDRVTTNKNTAIQLNNDYVGFLTVKNEYIIFRDTTNSNQKRYFKYSVFPELETPRKFYAIPNTIDITSDKPITINMAEGVFDIIGVYYHIFNQNTQNQIYVATGDSGYSTVIKYFLSLGLIGENITINIFSDSDRNQYFYYKVLTEMSPWVNKINLFYNAKAKDYGVPKPMIDLYQAL